MGDEILCYCYKVKKSEVFKFLQENNYNFNKLQNNLKIGTKCGACNADIEYLLDDLVNNKSKLKVYHNESRPDFINKTINKLFLPNVYKYYLESGFYVQNEKISTYLISGNWGINFSKNTNLVEYDCYIKVFGNDGKIYYKKEIKLNQFDSVKLDFSTFNGIPEHGWFLFYFTPKSKGLEGSIRPQVLFKGKNFVTSYHPQPHWLACYNKSIIDYLFEGENSSKLSVINAERKENEINIYCKDLTNSNANEMLLDSFSVGPLGSKIHTLPNIKNYSKNENPKLITVKSKYPTRKHIVNVQNNGSWNVDHFPNAK